MTSRVGEVLRGTRRASRSATTGRGRRAALGLAAIVLALAAWAGPATVGAPDARAWAAEPGCAVSANEEPTVDAERVYFGDARHWKKPAEVDSDAVFAKIPEYQEILDQKLGPSDTRYGVLMSKVRSKFRAAVCAAAKDGSYDLVAAVGAVKGVAGVPLITDAVIAKL